MIMEVNLISFLPLILNTGLNKKNSILYFLMQSVGSLMMLRGGIIEIMAICVLGGILLKASIAPFHFWGPVIIQNITKFNTFIFLT